MQLFVNQLTNVDFSYLDAECGLIGETWLASAYLDGALDEQGMVCDFGIVKKILRNWLDDELDHRLLVPTLSDRLTLENEGDRIRLTWQSNKGLISMSSPAEAIALIEAESITPNSVAKHSRTVLTPAFPDNLDQLTLEFAPESIEGAYYHYSHGLKKHDGNCQRIAHGHRSRIEIFLDEKRSGELEVEWSERWRDIYIGTESDIARQTESTIYFEYQAPQGWFELSLPKSCCYLMDTDTTVENIAAHLAMKIAADKTEHKIRVRAFEGLNKGAQVNL